MPKSIDGLMRYLRDVKHVNIDGSSQKRKLRNIGYYHGYKGYRYISIPSNKVPYLNFDEIMATYNFDMKLKTLLYPQVMFIETALKNYVLEEVISESNSDSFNKIYTSLLDNYKMFSVSGKTFRDKNSKYKAEQKYKNELKKRLDLRNTIYNVLTRDYRNNSKIVQHFYHKDMSVPIWAVFELISLGEFGTFVSCLNQSIRKKISLNLGLHQASDPDGELTQKTIYLIKDLRNSIAHNDIIFDTRFKSGNVSQSVISCLNISTGINNINFSTITDYIILITYLMKNFKVSKIEINKYISEFENSIETLRRQIPANIYTQIMPTDTRNKLVCLKHFTKI